MAGEADYALTGGPPAIAATLSGAATPLIGELVALPIWFLVVRPEVTRIEDLRGKRIGISQFGGGARLRGPQGAALLGPGARS